MTPQEKAISLVKSMSISDDTYLNRNRYAKECALVAVQEIICSNPHSNPLNTDVTSTMKWWMDVKQEIEKL
jgi:hypothetical protein